MKNLFLFLIICFVVAGCTSDKKSTTNVKKPSIEIAKDSLAINKDEPSARKVIDEIHKELAETSEYGEREKKLLEDGLEVAKQYKLGNNTVSFLAPLLKYYPNHPKHEEYYAALTRSISNNFPLAGDILIKGYKENYPNGAYTTDLMANQHQEVEDAYVLLNQKGEELFADSKEIDKVEIRKYVNLSEAYAFAFPDDERTPEVLFKAAEMSGALGTYGKTMGIFDWLMKRYPDSEYTANAYFLKGFMLDNDFKDFDGAKEAYAEFLKRYPNHKLVDNVKFLHDNLGKSDEELIRELEAKAKLNKEAE